MAMKYNNQNVSAITYNGQQVNELLQDGVYLWTRPFAYVAGSAVGLASLVCTRHLTNEPSASTGTVDSGSTVYYGDRLYWTATASTGYRIVSISYDSPSNTYRVLGDVTGVSAAGLSIARISGTITQGTLPTGVASITCYRKAWDGSDFSVYTGSTIYYGDQFYWVASPSTGYTDPSVTYGSSSNPYTWTGSQGGSITSVGASGLAAGELKQYAVSFGVTSGKSLYGSWGSSSLQARHFDKIVVSGTTVTCYVGDSSTIRWSNTVTKTPDDAQYSYTTPTITGSSIASLTGPTSYTAENTRSVNTYNIVFKYRSAYSTWSESTVVYKYGDTPTVSTPVSGTVPSPSTVTSGESRFVPASWDDLSQVTGARTITMGYTTQYYATISGSYCSANRSTGWYDSGTVITWTAESSYSFGGSSVGDTTTATITAGGTYSKTPGYVKCTIGGTRCSANKSSGSILAVGTTITWTASSNCAFNSAGTTTTATQNVALGTLSYSKSADYIYVTISGTNCSANLSTGWHAYGTTCTWTASTNYAFDANGTTTSTASLTSPGSTYEKSPGYGKYTVSMANCTANNSTGWYGVTSSVTTTFVAWDGWSFGGSSVKDTTTVSAPVPGSVFASPGYCNVTVSSTNCSANVSSGIVANGTTITWTASANYAFDNTGTSTSTATVSGPGTYSKSAGYGYYSVSTTNCTANVSSGWYGVTSSKTTTFTAKANWSFGGSSVGDTTTASAAVPGSASASPGYCNVIVSSTNCSANKSSGIIANGTTITWTASTNYAFDSSGTSTSTATVSGPGTYSKSPGYGLYVVDPADCSADVSSGWYAVTSSKTTTFTADDGWSFGGSSTQDTTTASAPVPGFVSATPGYCQATVLSTNCSANVSSGIVAKGTTVTWTANTDYAFDLSGTTTATDTIYGPGLYGASPKYGKCTITLANCTPNKSTGWYPITSSLTIQAVAWNGWSFGGSSVKDTTTVSTPVPGSIFISPEYCNITVSGTNCSANKSSGIIANGTQIIWQANTNYAFNSSGGATSTATVSGPGTYSKSPGYGYYTVSTTHCTANVSSGWYGVTSSKTTTFTANSGWSFGGSSAGDTTTASAAVPGSVSASPSYCDITVSSARCSANVSSGIRANGTTITWTANTNYAFNSSGTTTSTATVSGPGPYSKSADYGKYTVSASNCSANVSTGWYGVTSSKTTTFTANSDWSFGGSSVGDTTTKSAAVPGSVSASPGYCNVTVSGMNCSANVSSGIVANGTTITWTANTNYAFSDSGTTTLTKTVSGPGTYSKSPGYGYYTVSGTNCSANVSSGWYGVTSSKGTTFTANDGWSFGGSSAQDTTVKSATVPGSVSASPGYCNITVSSTNCSANVSSGIVANGTTITWTANTDYAFTNAGKSTSTATVSGPGTYSKSPGYGYYRVSKTHCTANVTTAYYAVTSSKTTTFTASANWSFGGSSVKDTTTVSAPVPGSVSASPGYCKITVSNSHCFVNQTSGIVANGMTIIWTSNIGPHSNYAFDSSGTETATATVSGPGTYSKSADYAYIRISGTNCTPSVSSGWYALYSTTLNITWTASSGYAFENSGLTTNTLNNYTVTGPTTLSRSAVTGTYGYNFGNTTVYLGQLATWENCGWASYTTESWDLAYGTPVDVNGNSLNLENWNFTKVVSLAPGTYTLYLIKGADLQQVIYFVKNNNTGNFIQCVMHCYDSNRRWTVWNSYGGTHYSDLTNSRYMYITDSERDAYSESYSDLTGIIFTAGAV